MKDKIVEKINNLLDTELFKKLYIDFVKEKLSSKTIKLNIEDISLEVFLNFHDSKKMTISTDSSSTDVEISGTLSSFIFYASTSGSDLFSSKISISGDVDSNALNSFFKESGFLQAIIIELLGQAASSIYSILEPVKERFTKSNENYNQSLSEFLKHDVDLIPSKHD